MGFKKQVKCKRCGLTSTFTNEVQYKLWVGRDSCPACTKQRKDGEKAAEQPDGQAEDVLHVADVAEWYERELTALTTLRHYGVITLGEQKTMTDQVRDGARLAIGLEPLGDELP